MEEIQNRWKLIKGRAKLATSMAPQNHSVEKELELVRAALDRSAIVAVTDGRGKIIHVNQKFCEISGYPRNELIGQDHRIINSGYHSKEFFKELWQTILPGNVWEGEIRNKSKSGRFYWVYTTIVPFLDENKIPYQFVSIRFEITERKRAEEQLRIYAQKLERSNLELQDFASIAAHDLQEPLRKILAFGDRLSGKYEENLPEEGRDYLSRMKTSARRMRRLIEDLLTYSRVNTRSQPFESCDLNVIVREVISDLEIRIESTKAVVEILPLPTVFGDPTQMRQLFQNLLANALKFHKPDQVPKVVVKSERQGERHFIKIIDNGIGFDEKYLDKIFTIFQRLHGRHEYEGTGVGLAVCRRIVERHGGSITAKSQHGDGAEFIVNIPATGGEKTYEFK